MRHFLTILFLTICFWGHSQVDTKTYSVYNDSSISVRLELADNGTFKYYDSRGNSCYFWSMTYGDYKIQNDTLSLYYKRLQERKGNDTTLLPVKYTMYDGTVITVTNAFIVTEVKKYRIDDSRLHLLRNDKDNEIVNWGNFEFALNKK